MVGITAESGCKVAADQSQRCVEKATSYEPTESEEPNVEAAKTVEIDAY
jgi:hypothetical protein